MSAKEIRAGSSLVLACNLELSLVLGPGGAPPDPKNMLCLKKGESVTATRNHQPQVSEIGFRVDGVKGTFYAHMECFE